MSQPLAPKHRPDQSTIIAVCRVVGRDAPTNVSCEYVSFRAALLEYGRVVSTPSTCALVHHVPPLRTATRFVVPGGIVLPVLRTCCNKGLRDPARICCTHRFVLMQRGSKQHKATDLLATGEPLDEHEQQAIIQQLQEEQLAQNRQFKLVFGAGAVLVAVFFAWAGWQQHAHPWEQRFTGELRTVTGQHTVTTVLFLQALSMVWAASALFTDLPQQGDRVRGCSAAGLATQGQLTASVACAATGAVYWAHAMYANIQLHGPVLGAVWDLLWLPLGPLTYSCLCAYVVSMVSKTGKEVRELQKLSYQCKQV